MLPSRPLVSTDTIPALAREALAEQKAAQEAARTAAIKGAKTNLQYLMAAGVIVTCDDELNAHYRWEAECARAKKDGVSITEARARMEQERAEDTVRSTLIRAAREQETPNEQSLRVQQFLAAVEGYMPSGRRCKHNSTKRERGWIYGGNGPWDYICCRCGVRVSVPLITQPTEQALIAAQILAQETEK